MDCTVYPDKFHNRVVGPLFLAAVAGFWYFARTFLHAPVIFQASIGFIGLVGLGVFVAHLCMGDGPWYRVDDAGVYDRMQFKGTVPWSDVVDMERLPRREQHGSETTFHLKEGWRPIVLTIRQPGRHLRGIRRWQQSLAPGGTGADTTRVRLEFTGLQPLSEELYNSVQHHLAQREREAKRRGASRA